MIYLLNSPQHVTGSETRMLTRTALVLLAIVTVFGLLSGTSAPTTAQQTATTAVCVGLGGDGYTLVFWTDDEIAEWEATTGRPITYADPQTGTCVDPSGLPVGANPTDYTLACYRAADGELIGPTWVFNRFLTGDEIPVDPITGRCAEDEDKGAAAAAAAAAIDLSRSEAAGDFNTLYDQLHPDAKQIVPWAAVVGWYVEEFAPLGPGVITVQSVRFEDWTWGVTGTRYRNTAVVTYTQPFADGTIVEDVVRLVEHEDGWGWFFGRDRAFVDEQIERVEDTTYTSPQLGYRLSWQAPWSPASETPAMGGDAAFRLEVEDLYLEYVEMQTPLGERDLLREFGTERSKRYPGSTVRFQEAGGRIGAAAIVENIAREGSSVNEIIAVYPIVAGERALLRILGTPPDFDPDRRIELVRLVYEDVGVTSDPGTQTPPAPTPTQSSGDCAGIEAWWSATAARMAAVDVLRASINLSAPRNADNVVAQLEALEAQQRESNPPPAAEELNTVLVSVFDGFAVAIDSFAVAVQEGLNPIAQQAAYTLAVRTYDEALNAYTQAAPYRALAASCPAIADRLPL